MGCRLLLWVSAVPELMLVWELPLLQKLFPSVPLQGTIGMCVQPHAVDVAAGLLPHVRLLLRKRGKCI